MPDDANPTEGELAILRVLWLRGPSTVRDVHDELTSAETNARRRATGYTTTLKLMQIMTEKGLLLRTLIDGRTHEYRPAQAADATRTRRRLVKRLIDGAFEGSASQLVMHALSTKQATPAELDEIRAMIDRLKEQKDA
jgi:predicted transcriptional regulator